MALILVWQFRLIMVNWAAYVQVRCGDEDEYHGKRGEHQTLNFSQHYVSSFPKLFTHRLLRMKS